MTILAYTHKFSKKEELANALIHGIGMVFSVVGLIVLISAASVEGNASHIISFTIFGVTMVLLYTSSTLVHSFPEGKTKDVFEILDHASIYFFIAGTYTPFLFIAVPGALGWTLFGIIWSLAIIGTILKVFFVKRFLFLSTLLYIILGWMIIFAWYPLVENVQANGLFLLILGGLLYTGGAVFYVWRGFQYHHAIWHVFVLAGSVSHFFAVFTLLP